MAVQAGVGTRGQPGARGGQPGVGYGGGGAQGPYGAASALTGPLKDIPGFEGEAIAGLAGPLWATDFTKVIEARLGVDVVESLETDSATIVLASTIPTDAVRAKVYRLLEKHYQHQGGKSLEAAGLAGDVLSDPGLLVTMKLLVRKEASKTRPTATRTRDRKGKGEQSGGRGGSTTPAQPSQQAATPSEEWTGTAERLVRSLCERLAVAGKLTKGSSAPAEKRLFEIPPIDVQVVSEYHLDWPDDLAERGKLSGVSLDPMTVHYVRYHQTASVNKALAFYRQPKQLGRGSLTERTVASGIWLESLRTVPESRRRLSVDVLVTKPEANSAATPGQGGAGVGYPARGGYGPGTRSGGSDPSRGGGQPGTMTAKEKNETAELVIEVIAVQTNNFAASDEAAEPAAAEPEAAKEKQ
jgi:hypothetical protein